MVKLSNTQLRINCCKVNHLQTYLGDIKVCAKRILEVIR